jgi:hypothetical protein
VRIALIIARSGRPARAWRPEERLRLGRLMGKEPNEAIDDSALNAVFLA